MPKDIVVVAENTKGEDFFIGDLHGGAEQLKSVLEKITEHDRLFLVGDLADRGTDNLGVYYLIMEHNNARIKAGLPTQIHITRGNHEDMLVNFYGVKDDPSHPIYQNFMGNGGEWATQINEKTLQKIVSFVSELPYITHGEGLKPFNIVHADMPFNDKELQKRIKDKNFNLTSEEKNYATWARIEGTTPIKDTQRTREDAVTYCGHSIGGGVRQNTNHVNLDIGTYYQNLVAVVAHHQSTCELIGDHKLEEEKFENGKSIKSIQQEIASQLSFNHQNVLNNLVKKVLEDKSLNAEDKAEQIDDILTEISGYHYRKPSRPLKDCQAAYLNNLKAISSLLDSSTRTALLHWIGNNKLHLLRFKEAANDKSFTFFESKEAAQKGSVISQAIGFLGNSPATVIKLRR